MTLKKIHDPGHARKIIIPYPRGPQWETNPFLGPRLYIPGTVAGDWQGQFIIAKKKLLSNFETY